MEVIISLCLFWISNVVWEKLEREVVEINGMSLPKFFISWEKMVKWGGVFIVFCESVEWCEVLGLGGWIFSRGWASQFWRMTWQWESWPWFLSGRRLGQSKWKENKYFGRMTWDIGWRDMVVGPSSFFVCYAITFPLFIAFYLTFPLNSPPVSCATCRARNLIALMEYGMCSSRPQGV